MALILAILAALAGVAYGSLLNGYATAGTAFAARIGCSCRYLGGRELRQCRSDFEPGMALVMLSEDEEARSVTARIPLVSGATATYREGWGCVLEKWRD